MDVRTAVESDRDEMVRLASPLQHRPDRHIAYLACDAAGIAAEFEELDDWTAVSAVALDGNEIVAWMVGDTDHEIGRVWWHGPVVGHGDWGATADAVYAHARRLLPDSIREEEFAIDAEFGDLALWAAGYGFVMQPGSIVLTLDHALPAATAAMRRTDADDVDTVGRLHEELFGNTHRTGRQLVTGNDASHIRLVLEFDGEVAGYVAVERHPDGSGYVDFVGVAEAYRRRGLGAQLIRAGVAELAALGCEHVHLTVREASDGARALYASLGFTEERLIVPLRLGFSLP